MYPETSPRLSPVFPHSNDYAILLNQDEFYHRRDLTWWISLLKTIMHGKTISTSLNKVSFILADEETLEGWNFSTSFVYVGCHQDVILLLRCAGLVLYFFEFNGSAIRLTAMNGVSNWVIIAFSFLKRVYSFFILLRSLLLLTFLVLPCFQYRIFHAPQLGQYYSYTC